MLFLGFLFDFNDYDFDIVSSIDVDDKKVVWVVVEDDDFFFDDLDEEVICEFVNVQ